MIENRASDAYKNFVDIFIFYQQLFDNSGSISDILNMPYPLFSDIILAQVKEKKEEQKRLDEANRKINNKK